MREARCKWLNSLEAHLSVHETFQDAHCKQIYILYAWLSFLLCSLSSSLLSTRDSRLAS